MYSNSKHKMKKCGTRESIVLGEKKYVSASQLPSPTSGLPLYGMSIGFSFQNISLFVFHET